MSVTYRFVLELRHPDGDVLIRESLVPDWEPAIESARLAGLRAHGVWWQTTETEPRVEPLWDTVRGEPTVERFRVHLTLGDSQWSKEFVCASYFAECARVRLMQHVAAAAEPDRARIPTAAHFAIEAYASESDHASAPVPFTVTEQPQRLTLRDLTFSSTLDRPQPDRVGEPDDIEVAIPDHLLDEVRALTKDAGERETGGVLLGHWCRDRETQVVSVEVTTQISARHTVGDAVTLTFTSDTWSDVRAALALRRAGEEMVGWWHSHPAMAWCRQCTEEQQRICRLAKGFLSSDDRALHRTMFPSALSLALVVTQSIAGFDLCLFGWRDGVLEPRAFRSIDTAALTAAENSEAPCGDVHPR